MAGGLSSRFGGNKALHIIDGEPLIGRIVRLLSEIIPAISIVANDMDAYSFLNLPVYPDIVPGLGPLGGIYTALHHAVTSHVFVVACDMPDVSPRVVDYMISVAREEEYDVVIPWNDGRYEPLYAIYGKGCLPHVEGLIGGRGRRVIEFFDRVPVRKVFYDEIQALDDPSRVFRNINYRDDLRKGEE